MCNCDLYAYLELCKPCSVWNLLLLNLRPYALIAPRYVSECDNLLLAGRPSVLDKDPDEWIKMWQEGSDDLSFADLMTTLICFVEGPERAIQLCTGAEFTFVYLQIYNVKGETRNMEVVSTMKHRAARISRHDDAITVC